MPLGLLVVDEDAVPVRIVAGDHRRSRRLAQRAHGVRPLEFHALAAETVVGRELHLRIEVGVVLECEVVFHEPDDVGTVHARQ